MHFATSRSFLILAILASAGQLVGAQTITSMGVLPTGATSDAMSCSANGLWVGGNASISSSVNHAARWSVGFGLQDLGLLSGFNVALGYDVSDNGTVVGQLSPLSGGECAFRWTPSGMVNLGTLPGGSRSQAWGISGDGNTVCGWSGSSSGDRAFRWTSSGMTSIGILPSGTFSFAYGISNNGLVITGYGDTVGGNRAFRWTSSGGMVSLGVAPGGTYSVGLNCNTDGSAIVGSGNSGGSDGAIRWTAATGVQYLGRLPTGPLFARGTSVTSNGRVVVGVSDFGATTHAFGWSPNGGMIDLNTFLPAVGVNLTGWDLKGAFGISADGTTIVGTGRLNNAARGWIVTGIPCLEPAVIRTNPFPTQSCRGGGAVFTVEIESTGSPQYQWQIETEVAGTPQLEWVNLIDGPVPNAEMTIAQHTNLPSLELLNITAAAARQIRVIVYNPCSSGGTASAPARLSYCPADFNCDHGIDFFDYLDFVDALSGGTPQADYNTDGAVDFFDYLDFVDAFSIGCI